ncbi:MAG: primosomal protein N', partial [Candidatus Brocadiia bacterium]
MTDPDVVPVAVPAPLDRSLDYLPPSDGTLPPPGARVRVPFGRRHVTGVVSGPPRAASVPHGQLKRIEQILDDTPILPDELLRLALWAADYYHHPPGEVLA